MTLEITEEKKDEIHNLFLEILQKEKITFRTLAGAIENFVTTFPAVPLGPLFYRNLEHQKIIGPRLHNSKFDANIALNKESKNDIYWWIIIYLNLFLL